MKLLILILGSRHEVSKNLINNGILKTYGSLNFPNIEILTYYGSSEKRELINKDILLKTRDEYDFIFDKTIDAFDFCLNNVDFDVMLRTNISTFIRPEVLYNELKRYILFDFFGSAAMPNFPGHFPAGAAMVFSRDVIQKIVDNKDFPRKDPGDDVGIGEILNHIYKKKYFDYYTRFKRIDILDNTLFELENPLFYFNALDTWCFRCKTLSGNRDFDIVKMNKLMKIFYGY